MQYKYFASSNSSVGFFNRYDEVFNDVDRIYIIKGGPGTGKSSLMKRVARIAEGRGCRVDYFCCSSDPESLDGIIYYGKEGTVGFVDGTAPHVFEPSLVGAREEIINLGQFWDSTLLRGQKNEIMALTHKKSAAYRRAYSYLRSCGNLRAVTDSLLHKATDQEKMQRAAERLADLLAPEKGIFSVKGVVTEAISMVGRVKLDTFESNATKVWRIGDFYGMGYWFLRSLADALKGRKTTAKISYDPICTDRIDGIFIEESKIAILISSLNEKNDFEVMEDKIINPKRFIHTEKMREIRGEMRYATRLYEDCINGALHALSEAKVYHFLLEDIYKNAMNFESMGEYLKGFLKEI